MQSSEHPEKPWMYRFEAVAFHDPETARRNFERISLKLSPALVRPLPALLGESPDPDSALLLFDRLVNEVSPETLRLIENHPFLAHYAESGSGDSPSNAGRGRTRAGDS